MSNVENVIATQDFGMPSFDAYTYQMSALGEINELDVAVDSKFIVAYDFEE